MAESEDDEAFLSTVRERYKLCVNADRENRERALEALAFRDLDQWDEKVKNDRANDPEGARPCLVVDKLNQHVHQVVNDERQNRPQIKVRPGDGMAHPEVAKIYDGMMRQIQYRSHADIAYDTAFECAVDGGFGYWRLLTEYADPMSFDQDIRIVRIRNRFACHLDPARQEPDGSDAGYGFLLYKVLKNEFKAEFGPKAESALASFAAEGREFVEWYGDDWVIYAEYFWKQKKKETIALLPDGQVVLLAAVPAGVTPAKTRETETCRIKWRKVTATAILDDGEVVFDRIPIVEVVGNELDIEGKVKRSGLIRGAMDAQRVDNYSTSAFIEHVALAPRASYVAAIGQLEGNEELWRTANRRNISVLPYKPISVDGVVVDAPQRVQPPGISQGWLSVMEQSQYNIQAAMGRYNATLGAPSNETSGKAIANRNREGDTGSFHYTDNLTRSLTFTGQMCVDALPKVYDTRRTVRILAEDGEPGTAIIDPDLKDAAGKPIAYAEVPNAETGKTEKVYNLSLGKYEVVVVAGPSYTTRRLESADAMMEISRGNNDFLMRFGDIIFKSQDWPGADQFAARFKKMLPPELLEEKGEDEAGKVAAQAAQVQAAIKMLGQREAELNALAQELQTASDQAQQESEAGAAEQAKGRDALAKVEAEIAKLNTMQAALESERELFALQQKLAAKELEIASTNLDADKLVLQADARTLKAELDAKQGAMNEQAERAEIEAETAKATQSTLDEIRADLARVTQIASAERELILDDMGEPIGSRPKMPAWMMQ